MATPQEKLAESLATLRAQQRDGRRVFHATEIARTHRVRLVRAGFLQEAIKGWLVSSSPQSEPGDSTPWFASFREFCARYAEARFGDRWHLAAEPSLLIQAESTVIPEQLVICAPRGSQNMIALPFGTSLFDLRLKRMPPSADLVVRDGLRLLRPEAALVRVPEAFFRHRPVEAQVALAGIADAAGILQRLLDGGHSVVAGRLAGAFRRIGRADIADEISAAMKSAGYVVRETDPFAPRLALAPMEAPEPPIVARVRALWESMRPTVIAAFPPAPGRPRNRRTYLKIIDGLYQNDAYHSLSIEGYRVTPKLIERVRQGEWDPDAADRNSRDALAARGYWQAFQLVKQAVAQVLAGAEAGALVRTAHGDWYRELFQPSVVAGIIPASALAGYRREPVFLKSSRHVPPRADALRDAMPVLFDLIETETKPAVRAVLGHWLFGYLHPYPDGNGRMARFLMNVLLASGGYPWTVIRVEDRAAYMAALERASVELDIRSFATFVAEQVRQAMGEADGRNP